MKNFSRIIFLLKIFAMCLFFTFTQRLLFYLVFKSNFTECSAEEILKAFMVGIAADASACVYFLMPFFLLLILFNPENRKVQLAASGFFILGFTLFSLLNLTDFGYFPITKKRMGAEILSMMAEIPELMASYAYDYWYLFLLLIAYVWAGHAATRTIIRKHEEGDRQIKYRIINSVLLLIFFFSAMRGYAKRPFSPFDIPAYVDPRLQWLAGNTPFQLLHTLGDKNFTEENYFSDETAESFIVYKKKYGKAIFKKKNILFIILESFCSDRIGYFNPAVKNYTPFLDSLFAHSRTYKYGMANGKMTIDALPSVLSGIPSLMEKNYCYSLYNNNTPKGVSGFLKTEGYSTAFFYGGLKSTFGFENYIRLNFSENYISQEDFTGEYDNSGWGVDDHIFLPFIAKKIKTLKQPFCASLLTLSLHHPFPIPEPYKTLLDSIRDPVKKSMKYTDLALCRFFSEIKKQEWFSNSVIAICADHTSAGRESSAENFEGNEVNAFAIPIVFHVPGDTAFNKPQECSASQIDMFPSVLDYMGYKNEFGSLGRSALRENAPTIQYAGNGIYQIFCYPYFLQYDNHGKYIKKFSMLDANRKLRNASQADIKSELEKRLKAYIQVFGKRINANAL